MLVQLHVEQAEIRAYPFQERHERVHPESPNPALATRPTGSQFTPLVRNSACAFAFDLRRWIERDAAKLLVRHAMRGIHLPHVVRARQEDLVPRPFPPSRQFETRMDDAGQAGRHAQQASHQHLFLIRHLACLATDRALPDPGLPGESRTASDHRNQGRHSARSAH